MTSYTRTSRDHLRKVGGVFLRHGKGDHEVWINPATSKKVTVDGDVLNRALANKILKDAGLGKTF